jgi:pimeloyl-ACP methyl ester carboxylesterase
VTQIQRISANGLGFAFLEEGAGPLVLLLHGFPDTAHTWDDVRPKIAAKGYRVVSPFMRGYHPTEVPADDADQHTLSRDVLALIEALGAKSAIVIGHDWGASAAYGAVALDPSKIAKLFILAIPHPATVKPTFAKVWGVRHFFAYKMMGAGGRFAKSDFAALRAIYARWSPAWTPADAEFAAVRASFANRASLEAAFGYYRKLRFDWPKDMRGPIAVPTVVFAGTDDPIAEVSDYEHARKAFTGPYAIETMPGGHFLHREHPEIFAEKLLRYL